MSNILSEIRLSGIVKESIVDGPGLRYVIFTQGCYKRCFMCHNAETQSLKAGYMESLEKIANEFKGNPLLKGITLSGGEPMIQPEACLYLATEAKKSGLDVVIYSGYYYEELKRSKNEAIHQLLAIGDLLIDGPFDYKLKNLNLLFRGSANQRIIDLQKTKEKQEMVLYNYQDIEGVL